MQSSVVYPFSRSGKEKKEEDYVPLPCDTFIILKHSVEWHVDILFILIFLLTDFPQGNANFLLWFYNPTPILSQIIII